MTESSHLLLFVFSKNPHLIVVIENPRALLKEMPLMQEMERTLGLFRTTVDYCAFGRDDQKPTDLWTNVSAVLFPPCLACFLDHTSQLNPFPSNRTFVCAPTSVSLRAVRNAFTMDTMRSVHEEMGISTGIDINRVMDASRLMEDFLERRLPSHVLLAGTNRQAVDRHQNPT